MTLEIVQIGDPVLRQVARDLSIEEIKTQKIQDLIAIMKKTMRLAPGVGLAAPQVGVSLKIAVIEDREELMQDMLPEIRQERGRQPIPFQVIINPRLTVLSEQKTIFFESCLSVKGCGRVTSRAEEVVVECLDENGNEKIIKARGWYARILQHEIDHLNGRLYVDIADKRTEIMFNEENKKKWINATGIEIVSFLKKCVK